MASLALKELIENSDPNHSPEPWNGRKGLVVAPDGLPAREVKAHNANKAHYITGLSEITSRAMKDKWKHRAYLDLFCGPGVCWVRDTGRFVLGSPLIALNVASPFTHYVFNDLDSECMKALEQRVGSTLTAQVAFFQKNANDREALDEIRAWIPAHHCLAFALLDPQGMDLDLATISYLSSERKMDLLINLPILNLWRCLQKGDIPVLDRVLGDDWPAATTYEWRMAAREHFHRKMADLGYPHHKAKQVWSESKKSPLYDFVLYSAHELAIKFFSEATRTDATLQQPLFV